MLPIHANKCTMRMLYFCNTSRKEMDLRAAIIGSGVGGLASAIRLRKKGYEVDVFERNTYPGGKLSAFEWNGFQFDAGPSLFTLPELVDELFELWGKNPREYFQYEALEVACRYQWDDGTVLHSYTESEKFAEEVEQVLGVDGAPLRAHLAHAETIYNATTPLFMERSLHRLKSYLTPEVWPAVTQLHKLKLFSSMHEVNESRLNHPKLVQLFDRYATYNGSDPYLAPGVMHTISHLEHNSGTYYPQGGMIQITRALVRLAQEVGVNFRFGTSVERILHKDDRVMGLLWSSSTGTGKHLSDIVVSNADVVPTYRNLLPDAVAPEKTIAQPRSSSAIIFYWAIDQSFPSLHLHNIFFSNDYRAEFNAIFRDSSLYADPTVYVNVTARVDATQAPSGKENWFVMVNAPGNTGQNWDRLIAETRERVISKLSRALGVSLPSLILHEEVLEPRTIESKTGSYQGSLYGAASNNRYAAFLRHPNFSNSLKGLYFAGGSAHPGGGIPLCLLSGKIAAGLIQNTA